MARLFRRAAPHKGRHHCHARQASIQLSLFANDPDCGHGTTEPDKLLSAWIVPAPIPAIVQWS
jgi:hypothetical protein